MILPGPERIAPVADCEFKDATLFVRITALAFSNLSFEKTVGSVGLDTCCLDDLITKQINTPAQATNEVRIADFVALLFRIIVWLSNLFGRPIIIKCACLIKKEKSFAIF